MTQHLQDPLLWSLIAVALVAAVVITRGRRKAVQQRAELTELKTRCGELEKRHDQAVREAQESADARTAAVLKSAMRTLQGLAGEQQVVLENLQREYGGHRILQSLLDVNHTNAQFARRAQGIAVLCGGFSGRRKQPASVYDVVRSAQGQIRYFERVKIRSQSSFAVVPGAVSGVALAVAELLANAASYSPPGTTIEVNLQPVPRGLCIVIDDAGVGMSEEDKRRAAALFSGSFKPDLSDLGNPPQFGFPVVAELADRFGFSVDVSSTSPYGGVRAVVRLPEELLTTESTERRNSPVVTATPQGPADTPRSPQRTTNGLPKRAARQEPVAVARTRQEPSAPEDTPDHGDLDNERAAARMAAFQRGTQTGRRPTAASHEGTES
ncbi:ATP-binding protein [Streptomyces sp. TRM 70361]|uniref:sensor histidine kinase n=1 Tax=Streptomyces sp. TRM 70361 TaxID=3116553 RepID=UPI002E7BC665|nr:ATP-binding protein [Streptomyces sp. TRM 70361]MEE1942118.1 ATP-binding protein [Streptomyces sp. TRM 70361]